MARRSFLFASCAPALAVALAHAAAPASALGQSQGRPPGAGSGDATAPRPTENTLAEQAQALDRQHDEAARRGDRAEMRRLSRAIGDLLRRAGNVADAVTRGRDTSMTDAFALQQYARVRAVWVAIRERRESTPIPQAALDEARRDAERIRERDSRRGGTGPVPDRPAATPIPDAAFEEARRDAERIRARDGTIGGGNAATPGSPSPTLQDLAQAALGEARAAPRTCDDAALNAIIGRLSTLLTSAGEVVRRYVRYTPEWEAAVAAREQVRAALREAQALRDGACPPDDDATGRFDIIPGYQGFVLPATGIGVTRAGPPGGAPELPAAETPRTVPQIGLRLGYAPNGAITVQGFYFEGGESRPIALPSAAGTDTGRVNGALSPGGSSGIIGPFGLDGQVRIEGTSYGFRVDLKVAGTRDAADARGYIGGTWGEFELRVFGEGVRQETTYEGTLNGRTVIGGTTFAFTQERDQEVDETRLGVGAEGLLEIDITGNVTVTGSAAAGVYHRWTNLASVERDTCSFCPAADRDFTIPIEDEDYGFGLHGTLRAGVDFRLSPRVSLGVRGSLDYWSRVGRVFNPNSGDQVFVERLTTGLRTADAWSWGVGAGLRIRLGPR